MEDVSTLALPTSKPAGYSILIKASFVIEPFESGVIKRILCEVTALGVGSVIALANYVIINDSTIENFKQKLEVFFKNQLN